MATEFVPVAKIADLPEFGGLQVTAKGRKIVLFKTSEGVFATDAFCPHKGAPLLAGRVEGGSVFCALHGWEFDLKTGYCPTSHKILGCHNVRVEGDTVLVEA
jgi:nitrite reductase/ring-hydroxylating ferredoxin subunit